MNEDNYVEWLVKRKTPVYAIPARIGMGILCGLSLFLALQTFWGILVLLAVSAGTYFVFQRLSVEYEYLFAEGGLSVDCIYGKAKRKKLYDCDKEEIQFVAPADAYQLKDYESSDMKVMDCSSGSREKDVYALIAQKGAERVKILFEPNEKMLNSMRRTFPRKIVLKKTY